MVYWGIKRLVDLLEQLEQSLWDLKRDKENIVIKNSQNFVFGVRLSGERLFYKGFKR